MFKPKRQLIKNAVIVAILVLIAVICRIITKTGLVDGLLNLVLVFIRTFIYIGLIAFWEVSVNKRVLQSPVRQCLVTEAILMVLWLILREIKYRFVINAMLLRYLWYAYYIPMMLIPLIALFVSIYLGKTDSYRLPRSAIAMSIPTIFFIISVLTNDFHQLVFVFPSSQQTWSEAEYSYGPFYYGAIVWILVCIVLFVIFILKKSRITKVRQRIWAPLSVLAILITYLVLYAIRVPFIRNILGDFPVVVTLLTLAIFELCIQCGLIQSNTGYYDFFRASVGTSLQIVDNHYRMRVTSVNTQSIPKNEMIAAENGPILFADGKRLHNMSIKGGHAIWVENTSELIRIKEILQDYQEELQDRNALLQYEYNREKKYRTVEEQNRLYDLLQNSIQKQLNTIEVLVRQYNNSENEQEKKTILAKISVLGTYIKRKEDLILSISTSPDISEEKLLNAFRESFRALKYLGIRGSCIIETGKDIMSGKEASRAYDFFEDIVEHIIDDVKFINVSICSVNGKDRISVRTDVLTDWKALCASYPGAVVNEEDNETDIVLSLEGGESL